jgi:uncharacterized protein YpuA (DUF1002 family)
MSCLLVLQIEELVVVVVVAVVVVSEPQKAPVVAASVEKPGTVLASHVKQDWRNAFLREV